MRRKCNPMCVQWHVSVRVNNANVSVDDVSLLAR